VESQTKDGLLPTPTATGSEIRVQFKQGGRPLMHMLLKGYPTGKGSRLQIPFVIWMMGLPIDYLN